MNFEELRASLEARNENPADHAVSRDHRGTDGSFAQPPLQLHEGREGVLNLCEGSRPRACHRLNLLALLAFCPS